MTNEELPKPEERLAALEAALQLESRLQTIEAQIKERTSPARPWWRDAKTVTILGALIAAVLPVVSLINNSFNSYRESQRLRLEQQEKIRQSYLDRVLKPGISEVERQRVFQLLSRFPSDPELERWAQEERKQTADTIADLKKERDDLERRLSDNLNATRVNNVKSNRQVSSDAIKRGHNLDSKILRLNSQIGDTVAIADSILAHVERGGCTVDIDSIPTYGRVKSWQGYPALKLDPDEFSDMNFTPGQLMLNKGFAVVIVSHDGYLSKKYEIDVDPKHCPGPIVATLTKASS